jgi:hypothetical protein
MENMKSNDLVLGTMKHYKHFISKYKRVKALADNAIGDFANELYMELDGITLVLDQYKY